MNGEVPHFRHNTVVCRICGHILDAAYDPHEFGVAPGDGSYSVCIECGEISVYRVAADGTIRLVEPSFVELMYFNRHHADIAHQMNEIRARRHL